MDRQQYETLFTMLKALADESRLALLRRLSQGETTVGELARLVELGEPTVSHHLARLREAELVTLRMAGNQRFYRIHKDGLARFKRLVTDIEQPLEAPEPVEDDGAWIAVLGWDPADQQVLREYTLGGQIIQLPTKQRKLLVILRWLATLFQPERLYSETEINEILKAVYAEDYISLRRDLVDLGYLRRERGGGKYWLAPAEPEINHKEEGQPS